MAMVFYVSPCGDDANAGSSYKPFGTIARAQKAAREAGPGSIIVLADGVYRLPKTLAFGPRDNGLVIESAPGAKAVISGGREVRGWRKEDDGKWSASVPWVTTREKGFRMLSVDGKLRQRSRLPKKDFFTACELKKRDNEDWMKYYYNTERDKFEIHDGDIDKSWDIPNGEIIMYHIWVDSHMIPKAVVKKNGRTWLKLDVPVRRCPSESIYRIENLREITTEPGEWALDYSERRLYCVPARGENLKDVSVVAPVLRTLVSMDGASGVVFKGVAFADSQFELAHGDRNDVQASATIAAAVEMADCTGCVFEDCEFTRLSGYAIHLGHGTRETHIERCRLHDIGAGGIHLDSGLGWVHTAKQREMEWDNTLPDPRVRVRDNEIADCEICSYGLSFPSAVGVLIRHAEGSKVHHNHIHDGYYSGVSVGWVWGYLYSMSRDNDISFNHIHDIGKGLLSDMGGIYTLGVSPGTRMCNNLIHDIDARFYGGWGLYNDEGSTGILVENNVVYNTKFSCYHMHFGRDVTIRNNIFAGGKIDQLARSRREPHLSLAFYNNIVYWTEGELHSGNWNDDAEYVYTYFPERSRKLRKTTLCDWNVYFNPGKKLDDVKFGTQKASWKEWREKFGQDINSVYEDPLFKDIDRRDFTLLKRSPALKMGFRQIDLSQVGPRKRK